MWAAIPSEEWTEYSLEYKDGQGMKDYLSLALINRARFGVKTIASITGQMTDKWGYIKERTVSLNAAVRGDVLAGEDYVMLIAPEGWGDALLAELGAASWREAFDTVTTGEFIDAMIARLRVSPVDRWDAALDGTMEAYKWKDLNNVTVVAKDMDGNSNEGILNGTINFPTLIALLQFMQRLFSRSMLRQNSEAIATAATREGEMLQIGFRLELKEHPDLYAEFYVRF